MRGRKTSRRSGSTSYIPSPREWPRLARRLRAAAPDRLRRDLRTSCYLTVLRGFGAYAALQNAILAPDLFRKRHEPDDAFFTDPNAVRNHAMKMNVQVERAAEALHEGDRARSGAANSHPARA